MNVRFEVCEKPEVSRRKWSDLVSYVNENRDKAVTIPFGKNERNNCIAAAKTLGIRVHTRKQGDNLVVWYAGDVVKTAATATTTTA